MKAATLLIAFVLLLPGADSLTGPQLVNLGRLDEALAAFRQDVEILPNSPAAHNGVGFVLDLLGRYDEARQAFERAINLSKTNSKKVAALRAMAIAWGFAGDCKSAGKYDSRAYDLFLGASDFYDAGEVADEMGRLCIDRGDLDRAYDWYEKGHQTGLQEPGILSEREQLWDFRWAHARARIAIRRGKAAEARKYMAEAKAILDRGRVPDQAPYYAYLTGYVEFYAGNYSAALAQLSHADLSDPFIQCLLAQTYEMLGNREKAIEYYRKAAASTAHSVPSSYAQPFAKTKLRN